MARSGEVSLCFVCLGTICRSPTAAGVMRHLVREAKLEHAVAVESAGTAGYHRGEAPDRRARAAGARRGIPIEGAARQFVRADWDRYKLDFIGGEKDVDMLSGGLQLRF